MTATRNRSLAESLEERHAGAFNDWLLPLVNDAAAPYHGRLHVTLEVRPGPRFGVQATVTLLLMVDSDKPLPLSALPSARVHVMMEAFAEPSSFGATHMTVSGIPCSFAADVLRELSREFLIAEAGLRLGAGT
jgi:hypothetical protein